MHNIAMSYLNAFRNRTNPFSGMTDSIYRVFSQRQQTSACLGAHVISLVTSKKYRHSRWNFAALSAVEYEI
jgi:hypothetical protein